MSDRKCESGSKKENGSRKRAVRKLPKKVSGSENCMYKKCLLSFRLAQTAILSEVVADGFERPDQTRSDSDPKIGFSDPVLIIISACLSTSKDH